VYNFAAFATDNVFSVIEVAEIQ